MPSLLSKYILGYVIYYAKFFFIWSEVKWSHSVVSDSLQPHGQ